jgi:hypothetical protein
MMRCNNDVYAYRTTRVLLFAVGVSAKIYKDSLRISVLDVPKKV